jgi:prepilin-type processing-associated H-X9-DG protein
MSESNEPANLAPKPRTSRLAIAAFVLGFLSLIACVIWPIMALPAITCSIIALIKIKKSCGQLRGDRLATMGIVFPVIAIFTIILFLPMLGKVKKVPNRVICCTNLKSLGTAMAVYANDYSDTFPPADQWCDLLIRQADASPEIFICPASNAIVGECTYAININVAGKQNTFPADVVLLFEAELKENPGPRNTPLSSRNMYSFMQEYEPDWIAKNKDTIVHSEWWNLSGGPELLSTRYHNGQGCNVTYVDGHSAFIPEKEVPNLRWTAGN